MSDNFRCDLNRFIPAIDLGHALLVPNTALPGKFKFVENSARFASLDILNTPPIAKLVEPRSDLDWNAPTVLLIPRDEKPDQDNPFNFTAASDYRYIQQAACQHYTLPVLNFETGWIYNLVFDLRLRAIDLLDYSRLLVVAAQYSMRAQSITVSSGGMVENETASIRSDFRSREDWRGNPLPRAIARRPHAFPRSAISEPLLKSARSLETPPPLPPPSATAKSLRQRKPR